MARLTLRLPEHLHSRLAAQTRASGKSLNQLIVESLERAVPDLTPTLDTDRDRLRRALGDLVVPVEEILPQVPEDGGPVLSHEELWELLADLDVSFSEMIIEDREDRI